MYFYKMKLSSSFVVVVVAQILFLSLQYFGVIKNEILFFLSSTKMLYVGWCVYYVCIMTKVFGKDKE